MTDEEADLLRDAAARGIRYRRTIGERRACPAPGDVERMRASFHGDLPRQGMPADQVLRLLDEVGSPATVGNTGGRYHGYVVGGSYPVSVAANWLATAWDQNAALVQMSPVAAHLDALATTWMRQALRLPEGVQGGLVTGATAANIVAIAAARSHLLERAGWDVEANGLYGAPELRVIVGAEVHASVRKALMVLGLGSQRVTVVEADAQGRLEPDRLPPLDEHTIVCLQAGHVHTGAFDPVGEVARRARDTGAWLHVDGAFGLWARASPTFDALTDGLELADSWATDAHKWLNVPYDCAAVFTAHDQAMRRAMSAWQPLTVEERQPAAYTLEQSRRARGVEVWATLAHLGAAGVGALVEASCAAAEQLADTLVAAGFTVANDVVLNQVLVSFGSDSRTQQVLDALDADGQVGFTGATWRGRRFLRISVSSWRTDADDLAATVAAIRAAHDGL